MPNFSSSKIEIKHLKKTTHRLNLQDMFRILWLNFKLATEGAGNSSWKYVNESRPTCRVADCIWRELNITNICDCKRATKQHEGVCPFISIIKDQTARSLGIKCVSSLDINFDGFSSAKLYQQRISRLHIFMKKIYNFPEKSELPKVILLVKN